MMEGYDIKELHDEAGRFYGVRIEQEVVQLTREEFKNVCARISVLRRENAKLRELVRDMWLADYAGHFSTLPEHQEHQADVWRRMRELGVEV